MRRKGFRRFARPRIASFLAAAVSLWLFWPVSAEALPQLGLNWTTNQGEDVTSVQISRAGRFVATGGYGGEAAGRLWDASNGNLLSTYPGHESGVISVAISPDERLFAVGYVRVDFYNALAKTDVYDIRTGQLAYQFGGAYTAFSGDGSRIVCAGGTFNRNVDVYELPTANQIADIYTGHYVYDMAFSPDGKTVATCAGEPSVVLWDVDSGQELRQLGGIEGGIGTLAFSDDGSVIAAGVTEQYAPARIYLWRVDNGNLLQTMDGHATGVVNALAFSPDGNILLSCGRDVPVGGQHSVRLWRVMDGSEIAVFPLGQMSYGVLSADIAGDAGSAVIGLGNGTILSVHP